jgi:hypothetical protein
MKYGFILWALLTGNYLFAQVIPVGFIKTKAFVAPAIVSTNLIINLDAANKNSYPGSGNSWNNLISNNAVSYFTLSAAGASYASNNEGVIRFGSTSGNATSNSGFSNLTAYTVEVWVKIAGTRGDQLPSGGNYYPCLFSEMSLSNNSNVALMYNLASFGASPNSSQYGAALGNGWQYVVSPNSYSSDIGTWVQIVQSYDGSVLSLYRNGVLLSERATSPRLTLRSSDSTYYIAKRWDQTDAVYGDYSMVNMYSKALTLSEIVTNYNAFRLRFGL